VERRVSLTLVLRMRESHQPRKDHFAVRVKSEEPVGVAEEPAKELEDVAEEAEDMAEEAEGVVEEPEGEAEELKGMIAQYYQGVCYIMWVCADT